MIEERSGERLTKDIINTVNIIRKKYNELRENKVKYETQLNETFKPLSEPLSQLVEQQQNNHIKSESKDVSIHKHDDKEEYEDDDEI